MINKEDFEKIINDFVKIHKVEENTTINVDQWGAKREVLLEDVPDILGSIPDDFLKVEIAKDLTLALYYPAEHFIDQVSHFSNLAYTGDLSKARQ